MSAGRKVRLDQLLVERGLAETRTRAQALVLAGRVSSGGVRLDKAGARMAADTPLEVEPAQRWVGRGGAKLAPVLASFGVPVSGRDTLDVGASTGGFTQALLEAGAARVIALDVGRGQLDWGLRNDPRVAVLEGINARNLRCEDLPFRPALAVVDVSFISLELVLPPVAACLQPGGEIVALVKPQFEVGRGRVGRGGIVRDPLRHREVLDRMAAFVRSSGWALSGLRRSPLRGAEGNVEFFLRIALAGPGLTEPAVAREIESALTEDA